MFRRDSQMYDINCGPFTSPPLNQALFLCLIKRHNAKIVQTNVTECMYSVFHSCFNKFSVQITCTVEKLKHHLKFYALRSVNVNHIHSHCLWKTCLMQVLWLNFILGLNFFLCHMIMYVNKLIEKERKWSCKPV